MSETDSKYKKIIRRARTEKIRIFDRLLWRLSLVYISCLLLFLAANTVFAVFFQVMQEYKTMASKLESIGVYLQEDEIGDGDDFYYLVNYFKENSDKIEIAADFEQDLPYAKDRFEKAFREKYPNSIFGQDVDFESMDDELKLLWIEWTMEYWFTKYKQITLSFDISYTYFVYPAEKEYTMVYMFDPTYYTKVMADGREILRIGEEVYEDPEKHENMWITMESGETTGRMDSLQNQYGFVYTYCVPLKSHGEVVGLTCVEANVSDFFDMVKQNVILQLLGNIILLSIMETIMMAHLYSTIIRRVDALENIILTYSDTKDVNLAHQIEKRDIYHDEISHLGSGFASMIRELDKYMDNLTKVTAERERIGAELDVATGIQVSMLPRIFPAFPDIDFFDIYASMDPAKEVGGDFYDFFMIDDTHLAVVIADVSGKGVPAALFMVIAKTILKNHLLAKVPVEQALSKTNDQLSESNDEMLFVTAWAAVIDFETGIMEYSDAGHESAFVISKTGYDEIEIEDKFPPLAIMDGIEYSRYTRKLNTHEKLFIYTDGVPEANNSEEKLYGMDRLREILKKCYTLSPKETLSTVRGDVDKFVGTAEQFDDLTMLCVEFKEIGPEDD